MAFISILEHAARPERDLYRVLPFGHPLQDQNHGREDYRDAFPRLQLCDESPTVPIVKPRAID